MMCNQLLFVILIVNAVTGLDIGISVASGKFNLKLGTHQKIQQESSRVVGGQKAAIGDFPYQVSLQTSLGGHFCGGTIITTRAVLTAGVCATTVPIHNIQASAGLINLKTPGPHVQSSKVSNAIVHPGGTFLAILYLQNPFKFNNYVSPVSLPPPGFTAMGNAIISGWGSVTIDVFVDIQDDLEAAVVPMIPIKDCAEIILEIPIDDSMVCTGPVGGSIGSCKGDSGGPLVQQNPDGSPLLVGIISWGFDPCATPNLPAVYANPAVAYDWIKKNMEGNRTN